MATFDDSLSYNSYSGADIVAQIVLPGEGPLILGELQTVSYSIHRENTPVRVIGHVSPIGFVKGPRTIAGSLIFTVFNEYAFYRLQQMRTVMEGSLYPVSDMLPPFDLILSFLNEYGQFSKMKIFGVSIIDEGGTMSIDDLITESTFTYMARGIQPLSQYSVAPDIVAAVITAAPTETAVAGSTTDPATVSYPTIPTKNPFTTPLPQLGSTQPSGGHIVRFM